MIDQFGETSDLIKQHRKNFLQFLSDPIIRDIVRQMKSTLYSLLHQHAAATDFNELARLIGDHEAVIDNAIQREDWPTAVRTLEERNNADLFYKYSSALVPHVAGMLSKAWMKCPDLDPEELLPVMASSTTKSLECRKSVLEYLKSVMPNAKSLAVHNLYFSLLCSVDVASAESYVIAAVEKGTIQCDISFAIRCLQSFSANCTPMCFLITLLGRWSEAVALALENKENVLARKIALKARDQGFLSDSNLKAIWLQIAKSEINSDPSVTGKLLQLSEGLLTVADVLQFFPEFATIDHFKQALCSSLEAVSKEIDDYQEKLGQTQTAAEQVRQDLKDLSRESKTITASCKCALCFGPLLNNSFLVFNCGCYFCCKCALEEVSSICREEDLGVRISSARRALQTVEKYDPNLKSNLSLPKLQAKAKQAVLESVGDECVMCGLRAVDAIDIPLIDPNDDDIW